MSIAEVKQTTDEKMHKSIETLKTNLSKIRTGRPSPAILDHVHVDYYGSMVPISQVANVTLVDARTLGVSPWERKMAQVIDKAIRESDLGLNPSMLGELIRVPMPPLSEERRKELAKVVKGEGEHAKVAVRNLRRDANDQLKRMLKEKAISEDDERRAQDEIQKLTDRCIVEIDKVLSAKEQEIMTV
ncbi:ribosome recycling factor [Quisquiliibacterium transsilvanicum]|uniref:Ribosome-recycling factor n=1 Tax=Quisquiliibacterium transsilvanicum TaxID=1549638 RepID=A0A7W8HEJ3_9BURK|nr:ribosome recycling factor [Quisquiliibacterium transsilvanicum]MBB5270515.1 ribosome recycling factor [Quisquiliibacterium transsilvanicum]